MAKDYIIGGANLIDPPGSRIVSKGVYAGSPAASPRMGHSALNDPYSAGVARLYIPFENDKEAKAYTQAVKSYAPEAENIARAMKVGYVDMIVTSVTENFSEKYQVDEVLSDQYISYFYGQHAPTFSISGSLYNTEQDDWAVAFMILYNAMLRGTRAAELQRPITLVYGPRAVTGVATSINTASRAMSQQVNNFNIGILVKKMEVLPVLSWKPTTDASIAPGVDASGFVPPSAMYGDT